MQDGWRSVFDTFDTDHDGSISEPEIRSALAKAGITDEEMRALMDQYDVNRCALCAQVCYYLTTYSEAYVHVCKSKEQLLRVSTRAQMCLYGFQTQQ